MIEQMAFLSETEYASLVDYYRAAYRQVRDEKTKAYPGIEAMLSELKKAGIKLGIVSNKGRNGIDHGLKLLSLSQWIDVSISKDDVLNAKPDPEGIYKALDILGHPISSCNEVVFIGDSGHDIETGKHAGTKTILVGWTLLNLKKLMLLEPDYIAKTPEAISDFLLQKTCQY